MRTTLLRLSRVALFIFFLAAPAMGAPAPGQAPYLEGLDALESRKWTDATKAFSQALSADEENADYFLARGIAAMMGGDPTQAGSDLERAYKLNRSSDTAQRWYAAYLRMTNNATAAARVRSPADYRGTIQEAAEQLYRRKYANPSPADANALRDRFENFGVQFAHDTKAARPELAALLADRMRGSFAAGKTDDTLKDLAPLMQANPLDNSLLHIHAVCMRNKGNLTAAREELTRVLTAFPFYAAGYSERAIVEARLGNLKRARADLALAARYDANDARQMTPLVEKEIAAYATDPGAESPDGKWAALQQQSDAGQSVEQLVPLAISLEQCMNAHRLRWDEGYQDRLLVLEEAVRQKPRDVPSLMALGEFIYRESNMLGEQMGPGGPYQTFRYSGNQQAGREIGRADTVFNQVLAIDPQHVMAMTWKAAIRLEHDNWPDGEAWVNKALSVRPDVPELLELLTRVLDNAAAANAYNAQDLRTPKSWWTFGVMYDTLWTHNPTQEELNRAAGLQQQANAMWARAEQSLRTAIKERAGTADGFFFGGILEQRNGNAAAAAKNFELAARLDPSRRNIEAMVHAYAAAGRLDEAVAAKYNFTLSRHTTATSHLAAAWTHGENTAYKKMRSALENAIAVDPCDTRIGAYFASMATANQKYDEALHWYNLALAMNEAHQFFKGASPTTPSPLDQDDVGLALLMNLRAASRSGQLHQPDKLLYYLDRNLAIEPRLTKAAWLTPSHYGVLPNPNDPKATTPKSPQNLLAWTHVMAAYYFMSANKPDQAAAHFNTVWNWPHAPELFEVQQLACAGATRLKWAKQDPQQAARSQWLANARRPQGLSREEIDYIGQLLSANFDSFKDPTGLQRIQNETMVLYQYEDQPSVPGGYDPKANPNYKGTDDRGPDDAPRGPTPPRQAPANDAAR